MDWLTPEMTLTIAGALIVQGLIGYKQWITFQNSQNAFGERVNKVELNVQALDTHVDDLSEGCRDTAHQLNDMRERVTINETRIDSMKEELQSSRIDIMSKLFEVDKAAAGRDALIMERLGRLDERLDMTKLIASIIREMKT